MTPAEKLRVRLDETLAPHGMLTTSPIDYPTGSHKRMDTCRWMTVAGFKEGRRQGLWSVASWNTITECLRQGFTVDFEPYRGEARFMVNAKDDR